MANPAASDAGWRHSMSREDRIKVCQHIMGKLSCTFASSTLSLLLFARRQLRSFVFAFESFQFANIVFSFRCGLRLMQCISVSVYVALHFCTLLFLFRPSAAYYQMVPQQALREKTSAFESQAYQNADSRTDYLKRIAGGLSNVERQVQQTSSENAGNLQQPPGGAPPSAATNPISQVTAPPRPLTPQQTAQLQQHQQQLLQQAHGQMPPNQYSHQQQLLLMQRQQQQHAKNQQAKAAASTGRAKPGSAADAKVSYPCLNTSCFLTRSRYLPSFFSFNNEDGQRSYSE